MLHAHQIAKPDVDRKSEVLWGQSKLTVVPPQEDCATINFRDCTGDIIGCLDAKSTPAVNMIMSIVKELRVAALLERKNRNPNDPLPGTKCSKHLPLVVILYGPRERAAQVGTMLSQKSLRLKKPLMYEGVLVNPHGEAPRPAPKPAAYSSNPSGSNTTSIDAEAANDYQSVFDTLKKAEQLPEMDPDPRIITPLLAHQKKGLYFMTQKEKPRVYSKNESGNNSLWRERVSGSGAKNYYHTITGKTERYPPSEVLGGILADEMGLGKTLSIISIVVGSLNLAVQWAQNIKPPTITYARDFMSRPLKPEIKPEPKVTPADGLMRAKTTLLICPMSTISNWEQQVKQHVKPGTLKYYIYHGSGRIKDIMELAEFDLVITTYGSVGYEYRKKTNDDPGLYPLHSANWFRIVLDEAHIIREQTTLQCKAVCAIEAPRRWAVTGTPVQNKLEDLGALLKFLRLEPFDDTFTLKRYILTAMERPNPKAVATLRVLVDSITLRRLKDKINLPKRVDRIQKLKFSDEEQKVYDAVAQTARDKVRVMAAGGNKAYSYVLAMITKMRLLSVSSTSKLIKGNLT